MAVITQGTVTVQAPDTLTVQGGAGELTVEQIKRTAKAYHNVGAVGGATAQVMKENPGKLTVPGVDPEELARAAQQANDHDQAIAYLDQIRKQLQQSNLKWDEQVHTMLGKVISFARTAGKYDASVLPLIPDAVQYFSKRKPGK